MKGDTEKATSMSSEMVFSYSFTTSFIWFSLSSLNYKEIIFIRMTRIFKNKFFNIVLGKLATFKANEPMLGTVQ